MATYRYVFADLLSDLTLDEMKVQGVKFDRRIIMPGTFKGILPITDSSLADRARRFVEGRTVVHVYRGRDIWGTYLLWTITPQSGERGQVTLNLQGATLESYLHRREIRQDLSFVQQDQLAIARGLISSMQAAASGDIGLTVDTTLSGVLRDRPYLRSEAATYGQRLEELANLIDGFEYTVRTFVDPSTQQRVRQFVTGYPTIGQQRVDHVFAKPGNVISWSYPGDATRGGTSFQTRGDTVEEDVTEDSQPLMSNVWNADELLAGGWPLLDVTEDRQSVTDVGTLDEWAQSLRERLSGSVRIPQATVRLYEDTSWSPNRLGDRVRLTLVDEWWPRKDGAPTFSKSWRVVGAEITPVSRDDGQESAKLIFEEEA